MNKLLRMGATGAVLAAAMATGSVAHAAATASANASVEVLRPLKLEKVDDMYFGAVAVNGAGTATLAADGTLTCSADLVCTGTPVLAEFTVTEGTPNKQVTIDLPTNIDLRLNTLAATDVATTAQKIELSNYVTDATAGSDGAGGTAYSVMLNASSVANFQVGGTLNFDGSEVAGTYEGTFDVSVEYS